MFKKHRTLIENLMQILIVISPFIPTLAYHNELTDNSIWQHHCITKTISIWSITDNIGAILYFLQFIILLSFLYLGFWFYTVSSEKPKFKITPCFKLVVFCTQCVLYAVMPILISTLYDPTAPHNRIVWDSYDLYYLWTFPLTCVPFGILLYSAISEYKGKYKKEKSPDLKANEVHTSIDEIPTTLDFLQSGKMLQIEAVPENEEVSNKIKITPKRTK